jgi:hypothetical protein
MAVRKIELGEDGQAMVEFALTFPLLLTLVTLVMQFALVFNGTALVRYAAYNAARSASVHLPLNQNDGGNARVQERARTAAALSLAPVSPPVFGSIFPGSAPALDLPGLPIANRFAYAWATLLLTDGIKIQRRGDFEAGSGASSSGWGIREPVYVTVNYHFALMIPPADQALWRLGGRARDVWSFVLYGASGGRLKALRMTGKAAFIQTGHDAVRE